MSFIPRSDAISTHFALHHSQYDGYHPAWAQSMTAATLGFDPGVTRMLQGTRSLWVKVMGVWHGISMSQALWKACTAPLPCQGPYSQLLSRTIMSLSGSLPTAPLRCILVMLSTQPSYIPHLPM